MFNCDFKKILKCTIAENGIKMYKNDHMVLYLDDIGNHYYDYYNYYNVVEVLNSNYIIVNDGCYKFYRNDRCNYKIKHEFDINPKIAIKSARKN